MKLDCGHLTAPVPWPIQSSPMASARKPTIRSNLRMGFASMRLARGNRRDGCQSGARHLLAQGRWPSPNAATVSCAKQAHQDKRIKTRKSPGRCRGFCLISGYWDVGSVPGGTGPVEAIDQRGADGLHKRLESDRITGRKASCDRGLSKSGTIVVSGTVLRLHKPAGCCDAEN